LIAHTKGVNNFELYLIWFEIMLELVYCWLWL